MTDGHRLRGRRAAARAVAVRAAEIVGPVVPGLAVFLVFFRPILDPWNTGWLYAPSAVTFDAAQSGMGWLFYSTGPWSWPPGASPGYGGPIAGSLLFSDSVPAFALPMKVVFTFVGGSGSTQIFGLANLTCLCLQSALGYALVRALNGTRPQALLGASFVVLAPVLLTKWPIASLFWQWLVLAGLLVAVLELRMWRRTATWSLLLIIATGVTPYVALMLAVMGTFDHLVRGVRARNWLWPLAGILAMAAACVAGLYLWGAFELSLAAAGTADVFGSFAASDLALIDSGTLSWFIRDLPGGTGEGFNYLGLGVLALLAIAAAGALRDVHLDRGILSRIAARPAALSVGLSATLLAVVSTLPVLAVGEHSVEIPLADPITDILGSFRANGRFMWPLMYALIIVAVVKGARVAGRRGTALLVMALVLQIADVQPALRQTHAQVRTAVTSLPRFQEELLPVLREPGVRAIKVVPAYEYPPNVPWREIGLAAHEAGLANDTVGYLNRYDTGRLVRVRAAGVQSITSRSLRADTVYVVSRQLYDAYLNGWTGLRTYASLDNWVVVRRTGG